MNDYLTAVDALTASVLRAEFLVIATPALIVAGLFIYAEVRADRIRRTRDEENRRTIAHIGTCGYTNGPMVCGRAEGHTDDWHADWTKDTPVPIKWRDAGCREGGAA